MILIKNGHIKPIVGKELKNGCILIDGAKIAAIGENLPEPAGAEIIDAGGRLVTPGCVEAHCHIGLDVQAMKWEGSDVNEKADAVTPQMRAIDAIYPQDEAFENAREAGVTTVCTGPGSAEVVSGTFAALKTCGNCVDDMLIKEPIAMKCAFGENPKNALGVNSKKPPFTRLGTAAILRELLFRAKRYYEDIEAGKNPAFDMKLEAMLPVMRGEIPLKCHAHRADDILTAVRIAKEFGLQITLDHCSEGCLIVDELKRAGYPVLLGPSLHEKSKLELKNRSFKTAAVLHKAGLPVSIITDAPVVPIQYLPLSAGLSVAAGLDEAAAWEAITINPAKAIGLEDRVGSLEAGKDADIVIWTGDPLHEVGAAAYMTFIDGKTVWKK